MFDNVIVGVDGRSGGRDAIALAKLLMADGGHLTLGYIFQGDTRTFRGSNLEWDREERERAAELLESERAEADVEAAIRWHGSSSVGRGLHELAESVGADLLVIGSSPRGFVHRVLVGDHTRSALNGAPCAVAIAPVAYSQDERGLNEIALGYDGSPESEQALEVARELAERHDSKLSVLEVVCVPTIVEHGRSAPDGSRITDLLEEARASVTALDGVEPHVVYGYPAEELATFGASRDLLIIGSRSYGPIGRLVPGSTAHELVHKARCPLLILTRASRSTSSAESDNAPEKAAVGS